MHFRVLLLLLLMPSTRQHTAHAECGARLYRMQTNTMTPKQKDKTRRRNTHKQPSVTRRVHNMSMLT